ncbi:MULTISPECIES: M48 family metalloprotease [Nocardiopsis]|uniref:Protease HtpX homolog n=2 Tax=Nocardiopsis alba TaxID=53437 RepID=A0A7K2IU41_9ACTN|nr:MULTISPECIES: M48 family metalloprotease [Nocardiopsis]AFR06877.1 peptidase M48 family protein [Nocardiopsis alba ATCC BAA-2165]MEC3894730.1 M48 family metalloprotease [Nocardiopsis sp. LDBS1602]MYR33480.1 M48 family metalloprotease [Nocardiopsis alba]
MHVNAVRAIGLFAGVSALVIVAGWLCGAQKGAQLSIALVLCAGILVYLFGESLALRAMRARPVSEIERPELYRIVRELATAARQPMPKLYLAPVRSPNAFATGGSPRRAALCCTTGLLRTLEERELRGVIAHELAHIRAHDTLISSVAATLTALITALTAVTFLLPLGESEETDMPDLLGGLLLALLAPLAAAVVYFGVGRAREFRADEKAAELTGDPLGLASALRRMESGNRAYPLPRERVLLASAHLMTTNPFPGTLGRLFAAHPPVSERIRRLQELHREWDLG